MCKHKQAYNSDYNQLASISLIITSNMSKIIQHIDCPSFHHELLEINDTYTPTPSLFDQLIAEQPTSEPLHYSLHDLTIHSTMSSKESPISPAQHISFSLEAEPPSLGAVREVVIIVSEDEQGTKSHSEQQTSTNKAIVSKKNMSSCRCSKLSCDKRYCSCFKSGNSCTAECQCTTCRNPIKTKKIVKAARFILEPFWKFSWNCSNKA